MSPVRPVGPSTTAVTGGGDSSVVASATVAIVRPPETAKSTTPQTKPIRIDRRQWSRFRWVRHIEPGACRPLLQGEGPSSELGEVLAQEVQFFGEFVDLALVPASVASSELADDEGHAASCSEDRRHAGEDRGEIHSTQSTNQPRLSAARPRAMTVA